MKKSVREVIVVEGRYDKNAVSQAVNAVIIETRGFGIFSDKEKAALLRKLKAERGIIVFTDSDSAGFVIRNHLKGILGNADVKHAYIPDIPGREKRKRQDSKEGLLGVEGVGRELIISALERAGATFEDGGDQAAERGGITKADMYELGLTGGKDSAEKRRALQKKLGLPEKMTANALLEAVNILYSKMEFYTMVE